MSLELASASISHWRRQRLIGTLSERLWTLWQILRLPPAALGSADQSWTRRLAGRLPTRDLARIGTRLLSSHRVRDLRPPRGSGLRLQTISPTQLSWLNVLGITYCGDD